jgi:AcrR family transcriptional regulator
VARTALYWHFGNKEGLLAAVLEAVTTTWIEQLQKSTSVEGEPADRLDRLLHEWRRVALERPELLRLLRQALSRVWGHAEKALVEGIEDVLGRSLPDLDLVAHTVVTLLQGALLRQIADPDERRLERNLAELRRTLLLLIWSRFPYEERLALLQMRAGSALGTEPTGEEEDTGD